MLADGGIERLFRATENIHIGFLVINANLHKINDFDVMTLDTKLDMLKMNIEMPTRLCDHYGKKMTAVGKGGIFLVSAMNFVMGLERDAVFQGSKAYLSLFAESLWLEYHELGVHVAAALVNGIEGSSSFEAKTSPWSRRVMERLGISMQPRLIVHSCLRGFEKEKVLIVPDYRFPFVRVFYLFMALTKLTRSRWYARVMSKLTMQLLNGKDLTK